MNEDILKGKWQEIKGSVKEKWCRFTDNDLGEIDGKGEKLLGLLQKKYGYIKGKTRLEYKDSVELVEIVSGIRGIMAKMSKKKDIMAIIFIARYGRPLLAKKQESQITVKEVSHGNHSDHHTSPRTHRSPANLAPQ
ncbi:MAG: CsbD family protein [Desulfobacterium sp.]|nr:CsbD family protein [Desulfobacterium sp.]MBU3949560.1 CsbD family protein [Pseudomonadota bacterium]MBU4036286.1 CsbD family protein [Pseudomonadota bacterium]